MIDSKNKISFFTSFNPENYGQQYKTWKRYAHTIYAIQDAKDTKINVDCSVLLNKSTIVENKRLHKIYDIVKLAKLLEGSEKFVIINSDIELSFSDQTWNKICELANNGMVVGSRLDYCTNKKDSKLNKYGFDFFVINRKIKFEDFSFYMGSCGWDWWLIHLCETQKIPVYHVVEDIHHKIHQRNWSDEMFSNAQILLNSMNVDRKHLKKYIENLYEVPRP